MVSAALASASHASSHALAWRHYPIPQWVGQSGLAFADLDGDGRTSLIYTGLVGAFRPGADRRYVLGAYDLPSDGDAIHIGQIFMAADGQSVGGRITVVDNNGRDEIAFFTSSSEGSELVIAGDTPLRVLRRHPLGSEFAPVGSGDLDGDGRIEIYGFIGSFASPPGSLAIVDYETGDIDFHHDIQISTSAIVFKADLTSHAKLVARATPGVVRNGVSLAPEWSYPGGFTGAIVSGNFDQDAASNEFASVGTTIRVFDASPYGLSEEFPGTFDPVASAIDIDSDGVDEIIYGSSSTDLKIVDARTGSVVRSVPQSGRAIAIGAGFLPGGPSPVIAYRSPYSGLMVRDANSMAIRFDRQEYFGPFSTTLIGHLGGGDASEGVFTSDANGATTSIAYLHVVDSRTGVIARSAGIGVEHVEGAALIDIPTGTSDGFAGIVVAGNTFSAGRVTLTNALTMEQEWAAGGDAAPFASRPLESFAITDLTGDGVKDVLAVFSMASASSIIALDGVNGSVLWETDPFPRSSRVRMVVGQFDHDSAAEAVVASGNTLIAIDTATRNQEWSMIVSGPILSMATWDRGAGCRLGLILPSSPASIFECADRQLLRSVAIPGGATFIMSVDESDDWYVAGAGGRVYGLEAGRDPYVIADGFGEGIGIGGEQALAGHRILVGSFSSVGMVALRKDLIFAGTFERP